MSTDNQDFVPTLTQGQVDRLADLVREAFEPDPLSYGIDRQPESNELEGRSFGRFQSLELVGSGGFGHVYRAYDPRHGRRVALKIPYSRLAMDPTMVRRFRVEAEAAAKLDHPGVVPLYEVGEVEDRPYIASAYAPGLNLSQWRRRFAKQQRTFEASAAASIALAVARAMASAHARGVVHRDVKPSNIILQLVDGPGDVDIDGTIYRVRIIDFGLAKLAEANGDQTRTDIHIGTPHFMAPEQFTRRFGTISPSTDVYGLGATLYTLIAGREPFAGDEQLDLYGRILVDAPTPLSEVKKEVPSNLSAICDRCLQKDPLHRYRSMVDLAEDLERFLHGRKVLAVRSWFSSAFGDARRLSTLSIAIVLLMGVSAGWFGVLQVRQALQDNAKQIEDTRKPAMEARQADYAFAVQEAYAHYDACNMSDVEAFFDRFVSATDLQGLEWRLLKRLTRTAVWRVQTDSQEVHSTAISPDEENPVVYCGLSDGRVEVRSKADGALLRTLHEHKNSVNWMSFLDDGKTLLTCGEDGYVITWNARTGGMLRRFRAHDDWIAVGRISPDGRFFVTCAADKLIRIWSLPSFEPLGSLEGHTDTVRDISISNDGKYLVSCGEDRRELLWDLKSRKVVATLPHCKGGKFPDGRWARHIHFFGGAAPYRAACCFCGGQVVVYKFTSPSDVKVEKELSCLVQRSALRPRDNRLFMTRYDGAVVAIDLIGESKEEDVVLRGHIGRPFAISLDATGSFLSTGDRKGEFRYWTLDKDLLGWVTNDVEEYAGFLDDDHVYLAGAQGKMAIHRADDGRLVHVQQFPKGPLGTPIRLGDKIWRAAGHEWLGIAADPGAPTRFNQRPTFDPNGNDGGRFVPVWSREKKCIDIFRPDLTTVSGRIEKIDASPDTMQTSHDGGYLAGLFDKKLRLYRIGPTTKEILLDPVKMRDQPASFSLSPDGRYLTLVNDDRSITVWKSATGERLSTVCGRRSMQNAVVTPDGNRILAVDVQGRLYLWDLHREALLGSILLASDVQAANLEINHRGDRLLVLLAVGGKTYNRVRMIELSEL